MKRGRVVLAAALALSGCRAQQAPPPKPAASATRSNQRQVQAAADLDRARKATDKKEKYDLYTKAIGGALPTDQLVEAHYERGLLACQGGMPEGRVTLPERRGMTEQPYEANRSSALADFTEVVQRKPDHVDARLELAELYLNMGDPTKARKQFDEAVKVAPTARALLGHARACMKVDDSTAAMASLNRAVEVDADAEVYALRAEAHRRLGDTSSALADFNKAITSDSAPIEWLRSRADLYRALGDHENGVRDLRQVHARTDERHDKAIAAADLAAYLYELGRDREGDEVAAEINKSGYPAAREFDRWVASRLCKRLVGDQFRVTASSQDQRTSVEVAFRGGFDLAWPSRIWQHNGRERQTQRLVFRIEEIHVRCTPGRLMIRLKGVNDITTQILEGEIDTATKLFSGVSTVINAAAPGMPEDRKQTQVSGQATLTR